jgi:hypothetical protein
MRVVGRESAELLKIRYKWPLKALVLVHGQANGLLIYLWFGEELICIIFHVASRILLKSFTLLASKIYWIEVQAVVSEYFRETLSTIELVEMNIWNKILLLY